MAHREYQYNPEKYLPNTTIPLSMDSYRTRYLYPVIYSNIQVGISYMLLHTCCMDSLVHGPRMHLYSLHAWHGESGFCAADHQSNTSWLPDCPQTHAQQIMPPIMAVL